MRLVQNPGQVILVHRANFSRYNAAVSWGTLKIPSQNVTATSHLDQFATSPLIQPAKLLERWLRLSESRCLRAGSAEPLPTVRLLPRRPRHYLLHRGFSLRLGFYVMVEAAHLRGFPLILQTLLARFPPLRLGGWGSCFGQALKPVELRRAGLNLILTLLFALRWSARHGSASR